MKDNEPLPECVCVAEVIVVEEIEKDSVVVVIQEFGYLTLIVAASIFQPGIIVTVIFLPEITYEAIVELLYVIFPEVTA